MAEEKNSPTYFLKRVGEICFNIKYDDCYPFIFTNIKGPILVKEEDMDTYIRNHEDDFIGQAIIETGIISFFMPKLILPPFLPLIPTCIIVRIASYIFDTIIIPILLLLIKSSLND